MSLNAYKGDNRDTRSANTSMFVRRSLSLSLASQPKSQEVPHTLAIKIRLVLQHTHRFAFGAWSQLLEHVG
jgi:hypothetical protein